MNPSSSWPDRWRDVFEESNDVVIGALLNLSDLRNGKPGFFSDIRRVGLRNQSQFRHAFASQRLNFEPDLELAFFRPDPTHFRPGITINHRERESGRRRN